MKIGKLLFDTFMQPYLGCFLRAEEGAAKNAASTASTVGAGLGTTAAGERSVVQPFYQREMETEHAYDPTQINELLSRHT